MQNLPVAGVIAPQLGQWNSIGLAHSMQNLALSGFSCWHFGHFIFETSSRHGLIKGVHPNDRAAQ